MIKKVEVWEKIGSSRWPILIEKRTYFLGILVYKFVRVDFSEDLPGGLIFGEEAKQDKGTSTWTAKEEVKVGKGIVDQIENNIYTAGKDDSIVLFGNTEVIEEAPTKKVKNNKFKKHNNNK